MDFQGDLGKKCETPPPYSGRMVEEGPPPELVGHRAAANPVGGWSVDSIRDALLVPEVSVQLPAVGLEGFSRIASEAAQLAGFDTTRGTFPDEGLVLGERDLCLDRTATRATLLLGLILGVGGLAGFVLLSYLLFHGVIGITFDLNLGMLASVLSGASGLFIGLTTTWRSRVARVRLDDASRFPGEGGEVTALVYIGEVVSRTWSGKLGSTRRLLSKGEKTCDVEAAKALAQWLKEASFRIPSANRFESGPLAAVTATPAPKLDRFDQIVVVLLIVGIVLVFVGLGLIAQARSPHCAGAFCSTPLSPSESAEENQGYLCWEVAGVLCVAGALAELVVKPRMMRRRAPRT